MKSILLFSVLFLTISSLSYSQCKPDQQKMLVLGDSWAFFSWSNNSYNENMDRFGLSDYKTYSTATLSANGTKASNYFTVDRIQELTDALNDNPSIEYIHLSLGGNDILGTYNVNNTSAQNQQDYDTLLADIKNGIDILHNINPNLKILLAGYDYPNFEETIDNFPISSQHPFYDKWSDMGQPNFTQLNAVLIEVTDLFIDSAAVWNNVAFVNNLGLMQNTYGQSSPLGVAPGGTYTAGSLSVPGGLPDYPSPTQALNFGGVDSFHLSNGAYENFIKRHFKEYYWNELRAADASITSNENSLNGTVSPNSVNSDSLTIGSETSILTFNTSNLDPQQNIADASIFLKRSNLVGDNLKDEDLSIEIKSDYFGASLQLEIDDFNALSDAISTSPCSYGTVDENGSWLRIDVPYDLLPFINKNGTTQFRLKYNGVSSNNNFTFYNTNNLTQQAILDIKYGGFSSTNEFTTKTIVTYPNPFDNQITIESDSNITKVIISDIHGRVIKNIENSKSNNINVNTDNIQKGSYLISIYTKKGKVITKKMIK